MEKLKIKGTDLTEIKAIIKKKYGEEGLGKMREKLSLETQSRFDTVLPISWVEIDAASEMIKAGAELIWPGDSDGIGKLADTCAKNHFNTVYKVLLKLATIEYIFKSAAKIFKTFVNKGWAEIVDYDKEKKTAAMQAHEITDYTDIYREFTAGYCKGLLEMVGARQIKYTHVKPDTNTEKWIYTWK